MPSRPPRRWAMTASRRKRPDGSTPSRGRTVRRNNGRSGSPSGTRPATRTSATPLPPPTSVRPVAGRLPGPRRAGDPGGGVLCHHHLAVDGDLALNLGNVRRVAVRPVTPATGVDERPLIRVRQCGGVNQRLPGGERRRNGAHVLRRVGVEGRLAGRIAVHVSNVAGQIAGGGDRVGHLMAGRVRV